MAVNRGSFDSAQLILTTPERDLHASMSRTKSSGSSLALQLLQERDLRVDGGDDHRRLDLLAGRQGHAGRAPAAHQDALHLRVRPDVGAERLGRPLQRLGHRAHAALGDRPGAEVPVADVADRVVRHHVAGAGLVGSGPRPDQAVQRHHGLDLLGLEEHVGDVGDAHRHQSRDVGDGADAKPAEAPDQAELLQEVGGPARAERGRRGHQQRTEDGRQAADPRVPAVDVRGVGLRELGELLVVAAARCRRTGRCSARRGRGRSRARPGARGSRARPSAGRAGSCPASAT